MRSQHRHLCSFVRATLRMIAAPTALAWSAVALAQGPVCRSGDVIQVQNVGSGPADVTVSFFDTTGANAGTTNDVLAPNQSTTFEALNGGFMGSCVVSADQPVAAIVNLHAPSGNGTSYGYNGVIGDFTAFQVTLPLLQGSRRYASALHVQNLGSNTNVLISYTDSNGVLGSTQSLAIPDNGSPRFDAVDLGLSGTPPFTADLFPTTSIPVVAVVNETGDGNDLSFLPGLATPSDSLLLPLCHRDVIAPAPVFAIQNASFAPQDVTAQYYDAAGKKRGTQTATLAPRQFYEMDCLDKPGFDGSARIESSGPIVAIAQSAAVGPGSRSADSEFATAIPGVPLEGLTKASSWAIGPADPRRTGLTQRVVNAGKGKATVTVTMRDGDGAILLSRNLKIKRNGFAEIDFPDAAVQGAFSIETRIKRKGPVVALAIEERADGEFNFVPAQQPSGS